MPQGMLKLVKAAHATTLLGYERPAREEMLSPYLQLGADKVPYDLNYPAAMNELKMALFRLGLYHSGLGATEQRWATINRMDVDFPGWDAGAADEFAIAVGRYRGLGWQVSEPYATYTANGPAPTATGLELIAGACRSLLKDFVMSTYESWRGGQFNPPSVISGPKATDPVTAPQYFGYAYKYVPEGTRADLVQQIAQAEELLKTDWVMAMNSSDEPTLSVVAAALTAKRAERDRLVDIAISEAPARQGTTTVEHVDQEACSKANGVWNVQGSYCSLPPAKGAIPSWVWWVAVPAGAAAVYWYSSTRKGTYARPARRNRRR